MKEYFVQGEREMERVDVETFVMYYLMYFISHILLKEMEEYLYACIYD